MTHSQLSVDGDSQAPWCDELLVGFLLQGHKVNGLPFLFYLKTRCRILLPLNLLPVLDLSDF
jgi:hypothetical protein